MTSPLGDYGDLPYLAHLLMQASPDPAPSIQPAVPDAGPAGLGEEEEESEEEEEEEESDEDDSEDGYGYGHRGYDYYDDGGWDSDEYNSEDEYINQLLGEDEFESTSEGGGELGRRDVEFQRFAMDATKVEIPVDWKRKGE